MNHAAGQIHLFLPSISHAILPNPNLQMSFTKMSQNHWQLTWKEVLPNRKEKRK